jgi:D123
MYPHGIDYEPFSFHQWYPNFREHSVRSVAIPLSYGSVRYLKHAPFNFPRKHKRTAKPRTSVNQDSFCEKKAPDAKMEKFETESICDSERHPKKQHHIVGGKTSETPQTAFDGSTQVPMEKKKFEKDREVVVGVTCSQRIKKTEASKFYKELSKNINAAIKILGGKVFPKLNFSAPRDSAWLGLNHSLSCSTSEEVIMLLKASDLLAAFDLVVPVSQRVLVLRKWTDIDLCYEFRCWVSENRLIAMCQRNADRFFPFLHHQKSNVFQITNDFLQKNVFGKFHLENFCVDIFLFESDRRTGIDYSLDVLNESNWNGFNPVDETVSCLRPYIVDFAPFDKITDCILYSWEEISQAASNLCENKSDSLTPVRLIESENQAQIHAQQSPFNASTMPYEVLEIGAGRTLTEFAESWQNAIAEAARK